jgi:predicted homoserine dehydrogenase-like protein
VVLDGSPTIVPLDKPVSQVMAVAKRNLESGEKIDGIGGFTAYGVTDKAEIAKEENALPLGLAKGMVMKRNVARGELIRWEDVEQGEESLLLKLYREDSIRNAGA